MIKVTDKGDEIKIKVNGSCDEILSECAAITIGIAQDLKKDDVSMREALSALANMAADIYEDREKEYREKEEG